MFARPLTFRGILIRCRLRRRRFILIYASFLQQQQHSAAVAASAAATTCLLSFPEHESVQSVPSGFDEQPLAPEEVNEERKRDKEQCF